MTTKTGGPNSDTLDGGADNDLLQGLGGDDTLNGMGGNDRLEGGTGNDKMTGGTGNDVYLVDSLLDKVIESSGGGTDEIQASIALTSAVANVENYTFTLATAVSFTGNDLNNRITGGDGDDALNGGNGNDTINGGAGNDTLTGASGDDVLNGGGADDILNGGAGKDMLTGGTGNDTMAGGSGDDIYDVDSLQDKVTEGSGAGTDEIRATIGFAAAVANVENYTFLTSSAVVFTGNALNNRVTGGDGDDTLSGGNGNDSLIGGAGNDNLNGNIGNDSLDGGAGNDTMVGGAGNDVYSIDSKFDQVTEAAGAGNDEVRSTAALSTAFANVENYTFQLSANVTFTGNALDNKITGGTGSDTLNGGGGNDDLRGGDGKDVLNGGDHSDTLTGGSGNDTLSGDAGDDILDGGDDDDTLTAGAGRDRLSGGAGNDLLVVENLDFILAAGGTGEDRIQFKGGDFNLDLAALQNGRISDIERIDLSQSGKDQLLLTQVAVHNASSTSEQLIVDGNSGDVVTLSGGFKLTGSQAVGGETYDVYTSAGSSVLLDKAVTAKLDAGVAETIELSALPISKGFALASHMGGSLTGASVGSAGDVNGDGFDDIVIGAPVASGGGGLDGTAFVVFGTAVGPGAVQDLSALDGKNGFRLIGPTTGGMLGQAVTTAGDFNGDGYDDLLIGNKQGVQSAMRTGEAFVVFGTAAGFPAQLDLSKLSGSDGFRLHGTSGSGQAGYSVASAGDVNGDGYDDLLIGAPGEQPNGSSSGNAYVVFGHGGAQAADIDLSALNGTTGFKISGASGNELARSVSAAGDVNGDGYADLLVSANGLGGFGGGGGAYVIFGHGGSFGATLQASAINGTNGFILDGPFGFDVGRSVSMAGDLNGDGYDDLIVVERANDSGGSAAYVVFGHGGSFTQTVDLSALNGSNGFTLIDPSKASTWNVATAGDFNGDGYADILVSAATASGADANAGVTYLLYGSAAGFGSTVDLSHVSSQQGLRIDGAASGDNAWIISGGGDVNGDGFDDIVIGAPYAKEDGSQTGLGYVIYGGNTSATAHLGGTGDDTIPGNSGAEIFIGGLGNDTLNGAGGGDTFQGGAGNDHIHVTDRTFHLADGGSGTDTLHFDFAGTIDFGNLDADATTSDKGKITGIEILDVTNGQANALTLHAADVLDLNVDNRDVGGVASLDNVLKIDGNAGDTLKLFSTDGWSAANGSILAGYNVYTEGAVKIAIDKDIAVTIG